MNRYLKSYQVVMRTLGPVFVGSGREIGKKEYIRMPSGRVGIPDIQKLYGEMARRKKQAAFEDYLMGYDGRELTEWLRRQNIRINELSPFIRYQMDCGDLVRDKGANKLQVKECIKDAYGNPYIPGSTLKGMFRTILLGADIREHPEKYERLKGRMLHSADEDRGRNAYLKSDMDGIENVFYRTLKLDEKHPEDAVNDVLRGFIVSDSEPLSTNGLVLCQKVDLHVNGVERRLPILRECIKPGTEIRFSITVDGSACDLTEESIKAAVKGFITCYYNRFLKSFKGLAEPKPGVDYVYCGGGCGFASKTIIYPMYGKAEGIRLTQKIFYKTKVPRVHKHNRDQEYGVSPHTAKCTYYQEKRYQMGLCRIENITPVQ